MQGRMNFGGDADMLQPCRASRYSPPTGYVEIGVEGDLLIRESSAIGAIRRCRTNIREQPKSVVALSRWAFSLRRAPICISRCRRASGGRNQPWRLPRSGEVATIAGHELADLAATAAALQQLYLNGAGALCCAGSLQRGVASVVLPIGQGSLQTEREWSCWTQAPAVASRAAGNPHSSGRLG